MKNWTSSPDGSRSEIAIVWIAPILVSCAYALSKGQDINWDQLNYHVYSIYALLHHRYGFDIAPSQLQTWTNPFGSVLQYFVIMNFSPRAATVIFAVLASLSVPAIYFLTKGMFRENVGSKGFRIVIASVAAIGAFFSPLFLSEIGTTFNDYLGATLILFAVWLLVAKDFSLRAYFPAGALVGLACGMKLTNALFVLGLLAAIVAVETIAAIRPLFYSGLGIAAAYIPTGGLWHVYVFTLFKNPLFPLYNNIFRSDAYAPVPMLDARFKPHSFAEALDYLPRLALGEHPTNELIFRDARFLIAAVILTLTLPRAIEVFAHREEERVAPVFDRRRSLYVVTFVTVSFIAWLGMFGIERYAILLEQLAPLFTLILLSLLCGSLRVFAQAAAMFLVLILATGAAPNWGRAPFSKSWYEVEVPPPLRNGNVLFVMLTGEPFAYVIPDLPPSDRFIRLEGNLPLDPLVGLGATAWAIIRAHEGEIRSLTPADYAAERSSERLAKFGLALTEDHCVLIETKAGKLRSCRLARL